MQRREANIFAGRPSIRDAEMYEQGVREGGLRIHEELRECGARSNSRAFIHRIFEERGESMNHLKAFLYEDDGVGVVEIILILVVLISLVLIFKKQLTSLVKNILNKIVSQSNSV